MDKDAALSMGSTTNSPSNHNVSAGSVDSARWDDSDDGVVILCPSECITESLSMCHADQEHTSPSRSTVIEFVLPIKIHLRYCWLFSGVPWHNTKRLGNRTTPLTDQELRRFNRTLMSGAEPELCSQVSCDHHSYSQDIKAFWLTADGRLVYVDRISEDIKFRRLRQHNLRVALSLWTTDPELCGQTMRASDSAHDNLIKVCGEAARLSKGRFYNLYANYPLPITTDGEQDAAAVRADDSVVAREIRNGGELLLELQPLYTEYFRFVTDNCTSDALRERVSLLGAQWLVQEDRSELQFSLNLSRDWFTRMVTRMALYIHTTCAQPTATDNTRFPPSTRVTSPLENKRVS